MRNALLPFGTALLALTLACGGSSTPQTPATPKATGLDYTNPPASTGWRLVKAASSTPTHLVLDLMPPAGGTGRGVGLTLNVETGKVAWAKVASTDAQHVKPGSVYALGTGTQAVHGRAKGSSLEVGLFQKGHGHAASYSGSAPVLSVALDFVPGAALDAGAVITLGATKARHLPAEGSLQDLGSPIALGVLKAN